MHIYDNMKSNTIKQRKAEAPKRRILENQEVVNGVSSVDNRGHIKKTTTSVFKEQHLYFQMNRNRSRSFGSLEAPNYDSTDHRALERREKDRKQKELVLSLSQLRDKDFQVLKQILTKIPHHHNKPLKEFLQKVLDLQKP